MRAGKMGGGGRREGFCAAEGASERVPAVVVGDVDAAFAQQQLAAVAAGHAEVAVAVAALGRRGGACQLNLRARGGRRA